MAGNSKNQEQSDFGRNLTSEHNSDFLPVEDSNEVLSPEPISFAPPRTLMQSQDQAESSTRQSSLEKKRRERCVVEGVWNVLFRLFQHREDGHYILEMQKNETNMYHLFPSRQEERSALVVKMISIQQHGVSNPPVQPMYNISLQERLEGWVVQERKRNGSKASDKYYIHDKVSGNFRSLKEVALFILYSCRREDLVRLEMETIANEEIVTSFLRESYCNYCETHGVVTTESHTNNDISSEEENTIQDDPTENKGEEDTEMDSEEYSIFSYAYDNPITKL